MKTLRIASSRKYIELHGITSIHSLRLHWEKRPSERCFSAGLISWADVLFLQRQELRISRWRGRASDLEVLLGKEKSGSRNDRTENAEAGFTLKSIEHFLLRFKFRYTDYSLIREDRFILTLIKTLSPYLPPTSIYPPYSIAYPWWITSGKFILNAFSMQGDCLKKIPYRGTVSLSTNFWVEKH